MVEWKSLSNREYTPDVSFGGCTKLPGDLYYEHPKRLENGRMMITETKKQHHKQDEHEWYEIEVEGSINPGWFDWQEGWEITPLPGGNTRLAGWIIDQPALHGIIARIRDLNLKLISLKTRT